MIQNEGRAIIRLWAPVTRGIKEEARGSLREILYKERIYFSLASRINQLTFKFPFKPTNLGIVLTTDY